MIKDIKVKVQKHSIEQDDVLNIGVWVFAITGSVIFFIQLFRGNNTSEGPDKLIYLLSGLCVVAAMGFGYFKRLFQTLPKWVSYTSIFFLCLGVFGIENHNWSGVDLSQIYWLGFGPAVLALLFLFSIFIQRIFDWQRLSKFWKISISLLVFSNLIFSLLSFWQSSNSLIDPGHSEYVINEIFAQLSGSWSFSSFIPQYQTFFGFFLMPFSQHMDLYQLSNFIIVGLTMTTYLTLTLTVYLCWLAIGKKSVILAIAIVIPLTSVTPFPDRSGFTGSIASLLSALPIRVFPGILLLLVTYFAIKRINSDPVQFNLLTILVGILGGIVAWQSQDFGVAAVFAMFITFLIANKRKIFDFRNVFFLLLFFIVGLLVYPLVAFLSGNSLKLEYLLFFQRQFGSGFGAEMMRTPGPILIVLPLIVSLIVIHGLTLLSVKSDGMHDGVIRSASTIGFYAATWSFLGFVYYVNRSYASGQMQILLLPISLSLGALIGVYLEKQRTQTNSKRARKQLSVKKLHSSQLLFYCLLFSLPFGSLLLSPNPGIEILRISSSNESPRWPPNSLSDALQDGRIASRVFDDSGTRLGYFGNSGVLFQLDTGIPNLLLLNSPSDLVIGEGTYRIACTNLQRINPDGILLDDAGATFVKDRGGVLCNDYSLQDRLPIRSGHFMLRIKK
jgi:hypothetical protein